MTGNNGNISKELALDIRRQVGTEATNRLLRNLPLFRVEADMPDHFRDLLDRLDGVEADMAEGDSRQ